MVDLAKVIPDYDVLFQLEPAELGGIILEILNRPQRSSSTVDTPHCQSLTYEHPDSSVPGKGLHLKKEAEKVIMEAWQWLLQEGFIAPEPGPNGNNGFAFVTRKGKNFKTTNDIQSYFKASALPVQMLHSAIKNKIRSMFLRGEHDTAVFQAFKEVEVAVREAGKYPPEEVGVPLMRKAFHTENGPLTDRSKPVAEREALVHLFAGAIGSYKNPQSHRHVGIPSADEAAEMIILASHLLRIIDIRKSCNSES